MKRYHLPVASIIVCLIAVATRGQAIAEAPHPIRVAGTLERVDGKSLILKLRHPQDGQSELSIPTDNQTKFSIDGEPGTLADLQPDMGIAARETPQEDNPTKMTLHITAKSLGLFGTIATIDGNTITLDVPQRTGGTRQAQVQTDDKTQVVFLLPRFATAQESLADLKPGMHVRVIPNTGIAKKIFATPALPKPATQPAP